MVQLRRKGDVKMMSEHRAQLLRFAYTIADVQLRRRIVAILQNQGR